MRTRTGPRSRFAPPGNAKRHFNSFRVARYSLLGHNTTGARRIATHLSAALHNR